MSGVTSGMKPLRIRRCCDESARVTPEKASYHVPTLRADYLVWFRSARLTAVFQSKLPHRPPKNPPDIRV